MHSLGERSRVVKAWNTSINRSGVAGTAAIAGQLTPKHASKLMEQPHRSISVHKHINQKDASCDEITISSLVQ